VKAKVEKVRIEKAKRKEEKGQRRKKARIKKAEKGRRKSQKRGYVRVVNNGLSFILFYFSFLLCSFILF